VLVAVADVKTTTN